MFGLIFPRQPKSYLQFFRGLYLISLYLQNCPNFKEFGLELETVIVRITVSFYLDTTIEHTNS